MEYHRQIMNEKIKIRSADRLWILDISEDMRNRLYLVEDAGMDYITVTTQEELKRAIKKKPDKIIVIGKLAGKVMKVGKIKKIAPATLSVIGALILAVPVEIASAPVTGGASLAPLAAQISIIIGATEISIPISVLLLVSGVGLTLISILFDEYSYIEISREKIVFERKRKEKEA